MKQLAVDETLSEEARESAKKALEVLVSSQLFDIEQVAALKKVESEAQFAHQQAQIERDAAVRKLEGEARATEAEAEATIKKAEADLKKLEAEAAGKTVVESKKEMVEWLRSNRLHDYATDVTRIAGECVASMPWLGMACLLA